MEDCEAHSAHTERTAYAVSGLRRQRHLPMDRMDTRLLLSYRRQRTGPPHQNRWRYRLPRHTGRADRLLHHHLHGRRHGCRLGPQQPDLRTHDQLVPLCQAVRGHHRLHRFHGPQIQVGIHRQIALVQVLPVRDRGHQHPHCRSVRLRIRHPRLGHHVDLHRRRDPVRWLAQRLQRRGRPAQHLLHDRLVRHLRLQEEGRHALAGHDLGVHRGLRPVELLLHLQLPAHPRLVLRPGAAAGTHRGQLLLEQGRLDSEPRQHAGHLVHVRAGVPDVPGLFHVLHPVREQSECEPCSLVNRVGGQCAGTWLHPATRQEAGHQPVDPGSVQRHQGLRAGHRSRRRV